MARKASRKGIARKNRQALKRPRFYQTVAKRYPDIIEAINAVGQAARDAGPLEEKTIQLVQLAAAAAVRSEGAVHSHTRRAQAAGATADEVRHAILALVSTIGFPNMIAALTWVEDELVG